ncbi:hypothetical protein FACS189426_17020 [Bacteroidia bacterium]|nr:hypothetical protein FACS189426_17020 [Bacteroidia bacterium]
MANINNNNQSENKRDIVHDKFKGAYGVFSKDLLEHESIDIIKNFMQFGIKDKDVTSSQLCNVFNVIIDKKMGNAAKRIKLTYILARNNTEGMRVLINMLDKMLSNGCKYNTIRNFAEACVAYHKYFETLKNNNI